MAICYPFSACSWLQNKWPRMTLSANFTSKSFFWRARLSRATFALARLACLLCFRRCVGLHCTVTVSEALCELISVANVNRFLLVNKMKIASSTHLSTCVLHCGLLQSWLMSSADKIRCLAALYDCSLAGFFTEYSSSTSAALFPMRACVYYHAVSVIVIGANFELNAYISRCSDAFEDGEIFNDRSIADCKTPRQCASERLFSKSVNI